MKFLSRLLRPFALSLPALGLSLALPSSVEAALATQTTTFTGDVPSACSFSAGGGQTVTLSASGTNLSATSENITIMANGGVNVALSAVTIAQKPNGTTPAATATLNKVGGGALGTASVGNNMNAAALGNTANQGQNVTIGMAVSGATAPGTYRVTVVLSCLTP